MGIVERKKRKEEKISEAKMTENVFELMSNTKPETQESQRAPGRINYQNKNKRPPTNYT